MSPQGSTPLSGKMRAIVIGLRVLSIVSTAVGVIWLMLLPLNEYSRNTYISENALLPAQVNAYFGGSDQNVFRAYQKEIAAMGNMTSESMADSLVSMFQASGLKAGKQKYSYKAAGEVYAGENAYAILHAPRGDATESMVLCAASKNMDGKLNDGGVGLVLALSRYLKRWSLWSKDIIFLITTDSRAGPQAWVDAYHDKHNTANVESLPLKSGAIQGVIAVDYPYDKPTFDSIHIVYDGNNGMLPNLDLVNTAIAIMQLQTHVKPSLQEMWPHSDSYGDRLRTMLRGMVNQGMGRSHGPHSSFIPYHIDAITFQPVGEGWQDEMKLGRTVESLLRSINNLLEHFHQSFFFYLLMAPRRFVSIGTYLPAAMIVAAGFTLIAIRLWLESGIRPLGQYGIAGDAEYDDEMEDESEVVGNEKAGLLQGNEDVAKKRTRAPPPIERSRRQVFAPLAIVITAHVIGAVPLTAFNVLSRNNLSAAFNVFAGISAIAPIIFGGLLAFLIPTDSRLVVFQLTRSFSLLIFGMFLSALATLNFSLSFLIGVSSYPLSLAQPLPKRKPLAVVMLLWVLCASPFSALFVAANHMRMSIEEILLEASFGWAVSGMWTQVVMWCVWYPVWLVGATMLSVSLFVDDLPLVDRVQEQLKQQQQQEYSAGQPWDTLLQEKKKVRRKLR